MDIKQYIKAVIHHDDEKNIPTVDLDYLESQKQQKLTKRTIEFIDREIKQQKIFEKYNITQKQFDEIEAFLEEILSIKAQICDSYTGEYSLFYKKDSPILIALYDGLEESLSSETVLSAWGDNFNNTFLLLTVVEQMISTFHYLNIIDDVIPKDRGAKIDESIQYILKFSNNIHLQHHLNELFNSMPERKNQIKKIHKHFFFVVTKTFKEITKYTNEDLEEFANVLLKNIFNASGDRITGSTAIFYLYSRPLKYFIR